MKEVLCAIVQLIVLPTLPWRRCCSTHSESVARYWFQKNMWSWRENSLTMTYRMSIDNKPALPCPLVWCGLTFGRQMPEPRLHRRRRTQWARINSRYQVNPCRGLWILGQSEKDIYEMKARNLGRVPNTKCCKLILHNECIHYWPHPPYNTNYYCGNP